MSQQLGGTMDADTKKRRFSLYAQIILWPACLLLLSVLWIWYDAVPQDAMVYGDLGDLAEAERRFAMPPAALLHSEGFALNLLLTFLFLAFLLAAALLPGMRCWRHMRASNTQMAGRKPMALEVCLTLVAAPLVFLIVVSIIGGGILLLLPLYLLACGYVYLRCQGIAQDTVAGGPRKALLYSLTAGLAGCTGAVLLLQVLLGALGMVYRTRMRHITYVLLVLLGCSLLVVVGQFAFTRLGKSAGGKRIAGRLAVVAILTGIFLIGAVVLFSVFTFGTDISGDILVITADGQARVRVNSNPFMRVPRNEYYQHICTFFMGTAHGAS